VRAAHQPDYSFPRINGPVDVANYLSLKTLLPISLWDLDRAGTDRFVFRLGRPGEAYVFNAGGQEIKLEDLIVGCRITETSGPDGEPIVNPVKDCLATKTTDATRRVAAGVYAPLGVVSVEAVEAMCAEFADLLGGCGPEVTTAYGVVLSDKDGRI
jgi:DNA/RNA-binding domain of Phe-tRNA-synthetase-like protein